MEGATTIRKKDSFEIMGMVLEKKICAKVEVLNGGINILISGGDLSHIGSVSIIAPDSQLKTMELRGHKDSYISQEWAKQVYHKTTFPVCVEAGVHYDHANQQQIQEIMKETEKMLKELLNML